MSVETVRRYFEQYGMADRVLEFELSSETVELAAKAAGTEPCRIAKTMSFMVDGAPILILLAGDVKVDNRKFKDLFHVKARFIPVEDVERLTGHPQGGVCPFALPEGVRVFLDESLKRYDVVYPAAGAPNNAVQLTPDELAAVTGGQWVDLCKLPEELA